MTNLLCAEGTNVGSIIGLLLLVVLFVVYLVFSTMNRKKSQEQAMKMMNELKKGDKVVTNAGIYGEIISLKETNMGKVVTIKTGDDEGKNVGYLTINASVILGIDTKEDLILDENGNVIEPKDEETLKEEVLKENFKEEKTEEVKAQPKKKTTKKASTKSSKKVENN